MLWELLRPDASAALHDEGVREALGRYVAVVEGRAAPRYLLARSVAADPEGDSAAEHERGLDELDGLVGGGECPPPARRSLLDLKALMARDHLGRCELCERRCRADRRRGRGRCAVGEVPRVSSSFVHMGEEPELVPSGTVFFSGCNLACAFCQNEDISRHPEEGEPADARRLRALFRGLVGMGVRNLNLVGGDPTPDLPAVLEALSELDERVAVVWNSNMYLSPEGMSLLDGVVDVWLTDLKYGCDECGLRLSGVERYFEVVSRNHLLAARRGELIVRHLMLPGHLECCTRPAMEWLAGHLGPGVRVNVMDQYHPDADVRRHPERYPGLQRRLAQSEHDRALDMARDAGLRNLVP